MITVYDIAKYCGVSPSTVSKVLNNYKSISLKTKAKVEKALKELNYIPDANAISLSKGASYNVGILAYFGSNISPFKHNLFTEILDSFQEEMNANNFDLLFISKNVSGKNGTFYKNCISRKVVGVLLFGDMHCEEIKDVIDSDIPTVGFDYIGKKTYGVTSNNAIITKKLVEHLISLGHKNISFICGDKESAITKLRYNSFINTLKDHHINPDENLIKSSRYYDTSNLRTIIKQLMNQIIKPTAIMLPDDYSASLAINILNELGYRVPEDISITGFDGLRFGQLLNPSLTTVCQDTVQIGKTLAKILMKRMLNPDEKPTITIVDAHLSIGQSTGKCKN